jgi:phosphopantothenoylcysteine decarboxylase/phosphopantothenate--cysteine ligase
LSNLREVAPHAIRVGFAAETENLEQEAQRKLESKQAHFIVANDVSKEGSGFDSEFNEVILFGRDGYHRQLTMKHKRLLATELFDIFAETLRTRETGVVSRN